MAAGRLVTLVGPGGVGKTRLAIEAARQAVLDRTVMKRIGEASDIADAVAYFALDAPYVTGQILAVDGGRSLNM